MATKSTELIFRGCSFFSLTATLFLLNIYKKRRKIDLSKFQKYGIIFSLFFLMNLFLFFYLHYRNVEREQMFISNGLYSTWNIVLRDSNFDESEILSYLPNDGRLFFEHDDTGRIRSLYRRSDWKPSLIEGTFFDDDYAGLQAVVGSNVLQNLANGNYFEIAGFYYEIIGTLGVEYPSPLDHLVLLNNRDELPVVRIVVDAENPSSLREVTSQFEVLTVNINQAMTRFLNSNRFDQLISLNVWAVLGILVGVSAYICFDLFKKTYTVFSLLGYEKVKIFRKQVLAINVMYFLSISSVLISHLIFDINFVNSSLHIYLIVLIAILIFYSFIVFINGIIGGESNDA